MSLSAAVQPFTIPVRVYYEDTDAAGIVFYANHLKFMERSRTELLRSLLLESGTMMKQQRIFVVVDVQLKYHLPAQLDDMLDVTTVVESVGRSRFIFRQQVIRQGSTETLCSGRIAVACLDTASMRPVALPLDTVAVLRSLVAE